uniref:Uncharacterized protein n=1 Tax=Cuerna arida TaxID=1464854 RepID=A0A1B6G8S4_9HEMI
MFEFYSRDATTNFTESCFKCLPPTQMILPKPPPTPWGPIPPTPPTLPSPLTETSPTPLIPSGPTPAPAPIRPNMGTSALACNATPSSLTLPIPWVETTSGTPRTPPPTTPPKLSLAAPTSIKPGAP